jgi:hypothetical protein
MSSSYNTVLEINFLHYSLTEPFHAFTSFVKPQIVNPLSFSAVDLVVFQSTKTK